MDSNEYVNPISGMYILDPSGIPLFARYFHGKETNIDSTLLGGFFSAIEVFVKTSLNEMLTDIGMTTSRYFFDRASNGYIIVLIVSTPGRDLIDQSTKILIEKVMGSLKLYFEILIEICGSLLLNLHAMIEQMGPSIDNILFESNMEILDLEILKTKEYKLNKGEELSEELLNEIKGKIRDG